MDDPTVVAVMLTRDRPEYARRAVACFRAQSYDPVRRLLMILDGGDPFWYDRRCDSENEVHLGAAGHAGKTIGSLRNIATAQADAAVLIHWDDDDYSHPNRIAEQVALLQTSGADCVGYRQMLFWDETKCMIEINPGVQYGAGVLGKVQSVGMTYLYTNTDPTYCLGTSLCYWRRTWEQHPFSERNGPNPRERGEDREFLREIKSWGVCSIPDAGLAKPGSCEPRMIARIHAGNAAHYPVDELVQSSANWRRAPEWKERVREIMEGVHCESGTR